MPPVFCAQLSREQNDPLPGSAAHVERHLLVSWPRAKWQRNLRHASDMPSEIGVTLDAIAAAGRRVNLIQQPGMEATRHRIFLMPERRRFTVARDALGEFLDAWQTGNSLARWEEPRLAHDLILCCTHAKKDKCCAKYGYQTFKALAQAVAEHELPFEVWESSHLGGCRLAASLIVLSPVRKYGRIAPDQALAFLQSEASGQRYLPGYRGNSSLSPAQQCAEVALLEHLEQAHALTAPTLIDDHGDERERIMRWQLDTPPYHATVHCRARSILRVDTCADLAQGPTESLVWQARVDI
ncbi:sucrase ferredoxin [Vreelandella malpeensis]|uniref:Sucrase ferredoxin n=1 Tax=Vreelandella malpeensis TaxID=1172368 RepID=A0ABS8DRS3_9GAMM|nr:sucrase ferredoxin [Halomonas malpeensis]MCB8889017.1 sucrase ferredoxin [Halomonas malpeensis]